METTRGTLFQQISKLFSALQWANSWYFVIFSMDAKLWLCIIHFFYVCARQSSEIDFFSADLFMTRCFPFASFIRTRVHIHKHISTDTFFIAHQNQPMHIVNPYTIILCVARARARAPNTFLHVVRVSNCRLNKVKNEESSIFSTLVTHMHISRISQ